MGVDIRGFERELHESDRQRLISMYVHEMDLEKAFFELKETENLSWIRRYQDPVATVDPIEYFELYREQLIRLPPVILDVATTEKSQTT